MRRMPSPTIIDIEASGFGSRSYPIEIGVVKTNGERYCALIEPQPEWDHWSDSAQAMHGISRRLILSRGRTPRDICLELNDFLGEITAYSDAWTHDKPWLSRLFFAGRVAPGFRLSPIEIIATEEQLLLWDKTKMRLEKRLDIKRHRASGDAYLIQQTFLETRRQIDTQPLQARRTGI
jgi:hypothetical protein